MEAEKEALDKEKIADEAEEDVEDARREVRRAEQELENAEKSRKDAEASQRRARELREQLAECEKRAEEEGRRLKALEDAKRRMEKTEEVIKAQREEHRKKVEERLKEKEAREQVAAEEALAKKAFDDALTAMEELGKVKGGEGLANAAKFLKWAGWALEKGKLIADLASGRAAARILEALRDFLNDPDILTAYRYIHTWNESVGLTEGPFGVISYYMALGIASKLVEMAKRIPPKVRDKVTDYITRMLEEMKR